MKRVSVIGISVATAALIIGGCGSSSSGPSAPSEIKAATSIDLATVESALSMLYNGGITAASAPASTMKAAVADIKTAIQAKVAAGSGSGENSYSYTYDCQISGTRTNSYESSYDYPAEGGWTETYKYTYRYDHCIDNSSATINGEPANRYFENGTYSYTNSATYSIDSNMSKETWSWSDNRSYGYDNNETTTSRTYTRKNNGKETWEADGDYFDATGVPAWSDTWHYSGSDKRVDINSSGKVSGGERNVYNETWTDSGAQDNSHYKTMADGFYSHYETDANGVESLTGGEYYNNFVMEVYANGSEENITISGTYGTTCLGGSVTFKTDPVVQSNQDDYFDGDGLHGNNVLPYAGTVTVSGSGSATVGFDANASMYSTVTIVAPDGNATYSRWDDIPAGTCSAMMP
ncbi:hypothetical protein WCX72_08830 [Sulfurimonas sp. HSL1-6]|uniref:hypothetical protein n=1 Tax=Thiomicrolovo immobilis TaxID=3131935 RepID=UPI0031F94676